MRYRVLQHGITRRCRDEEMENRVEEEYMWEKPLGHRNTYIHANLVLYIFAR
jgi:hypothetical protein